MDVNKGRLFMKEQTNCVSMCNHFVGLVLKGLRLGYDDNGNLSFEKLQVKEKSVSI